MTAPTPASSASCVYEDDLVTLHNGDCLDVLATLADDSVDAVVTDPPYGLGFMGKEWDDLPPGEPWARECLRILKPGGHLLAFGGTRTSHRLACAIEDAGFELRDTIAWLYGSGFPKSLDVSKAIDKAAGAERQVIGPGRWNGVKGSKGREGGITPDGFVSHGGTQHDATSPATPAAERWQGWGTALKPANEPIIVARKPPVGTVATNVLAYGTGALNIDGCRTSWGPDGDKSADRKAKGYTDAAKKALGGVVASESATGFSGEVVGTDSTSGRWPTNVVLDPEAAEALDRQTGVSRSRIGAPRSGPNGDGWGMTATGTEYDDQGGASRFFPIFRYEAKAPTDERPKVGIIAHPTVKPLDLMRWLVRLVTPPGGVVLDTFAGSGTTAEACIVEGFRCIAIEREADYIPLILARISKPIEPVMFGMEAS